jgi:beta-lactamase class A
MSLRLQLLGLALKNKMREASVNALAGVEEHVHKITRRISGNFGIAVKVLQSDLSFFHNEHMLCPAASTIKIHILLELLNQVRAGKHSLDELVELPSRKTSEGAWSATASGVLKELESVRRISLKDTATLMIIVSDNIAANLLIDLLGMDRIQETIQTLGLKKTKLVRKMMDLKSSRKGLENVSTPHELMLTMENVARAQFLDNQGSEMVLDILSKTQDVFGLRRLIPAEVRMEHKTGEFFSVCNDAGIVHAPRNPFIISIMSKDVNLVDGWDTVAELGKLFYDRLSSTS